MYTLYSTNKQTHTHTGDRDFYDAEHTVNIRRANITTHNTLIHAQYTLNAIIYAVFFMPFTNFNSSHDCQIKQISKIILQLADQ